MMRFILDCLRTPRQRAPGGERDKNPLEQDERVIQKTSQIKELEDVVQAESVELQEQHADRRELEDTLERLDGQRAELVEQIKLTRLQCCQESQQILSLQAEEVKRESAVEEYERELARVRRKLKRLREEVRSAQRKTEEAGERTGPLQESISQSYDEILEEEQKLSALTGERTGDAALTPELQQGEPEEPSPPSATTEEVPIRPWGRSQSLPAYADVILRRCGSSCITNVALSDTQEEEDTPVSSTSKMITSQGEEGRREEEGLKEQEQCAALPECTSSIALNQLDFYHPDPFVHCETEHDLFKEDFFAETDQSDVFADDPFKGTDPFAADILFPEGSEVEYPDAEPLPDGSSPPEAGLNDELDTSLSCAENKASTGTQCFESEFPDEDESSEIEMSYSQEDLDTIAMGNDPATTSYGTTQNVTLTQQFKPTQAASPDAQHIDLAGPEGFEPLGLGLDPSRETRASTWSAQPNYSVESDPNGYEFDINAVSPPSDIEEVSLGSMPVGYDAVAAGFRSPPGLDLHSAEADPSDVGEIQTRPGVDEAAGSSPDQAGYPGSSPDQAGYPRSSPDQAGYPRSSPDQAEYPRSSPDQAGYPGSNPVQAGYPGSSPDEVGYPGSSPDQAGYPRSTTTTPEPVPSETCGGGADPGDVTSADRAQRSSSELDSAIGLDAQSGSEHNSKFGFGADSFEYSYEPASHASFDPYGFKLSPEHNSVQDILDPFGSDLASDPGDRASFDPYEFEASSSSQPDDDGVTFDPYGFRLTPQPSQLSAYDPYGFKLSPETDNQALLHLGNSSDDPQNPEKNNNNTLSEMDPFGFELGSEPASSEPAGSAAVDDLLGLELSNTVAPERTPPSTTSSPSTAPADAPTTSATTNMAAGAGCDLLGGDLLDSVFGTGGYVACPDVADYLEPLEPGVGNPEDPPPDNRVFRGREATRSSDAVADWMTVRSNSKESSGPVIPHTHSLD